MNTYALFLIHPSLFFSIYFKNQGKQPPVKSVDCAENLTTFGIRFLDRPSCSELLYRVSCPDPKADTVTFAVRGVDLCYVNSTHLAECSTTLLENR